MNHFIAFSTASLIAGAFLISLEKAPVGDLYLGAPVIADAEGGSEGRQAWELTRLADPSTGRIPYGIRAKELAYAATLPNDAFFSSSNKMMATWQARGPWNVGGRTRGFAMDINNENIFMAGSTSGGVWRTIDGGTTWTKSTSNSNAYSVTALIQDRRTGSTNNWYYSTGEGYGQSASGTGAYYLGNGIYKSTDAGSTWNSLAPTATNTPHTFESGWDVIWNIAMDYSNAVQEEIYAARYGGISRSTDGGLTWATVRGGNPANYYSDIAVSPTGIVYATMSDDGIHKGIWRSPDGTTWTRITPTNFATVYDRLVIGISPSNEEQVWFLGHTPGFGQPDTNFQGTVEWNSLWKYRYLSGDGDSVGGAWEDHSIYLPTSGGMFDKFSCQGSYDLVVRVHPADTNMVFIGGTNLYRSDDGFNSLTNTTFIGGYQQGASFPVVNMYTNHHPDQHLLHFLPSNDSVLFSMNDGGVFRTNNCFASNVSWTSLNNGYLTSMFYTVAIDHATPGNDIIVAGAQDNGSWFTNNSNLTSPWVTPRGGDGSYCYIANGQSMYYLSIQNGKMMKATLDGNGIVQNFARIDPIGGNSYLFINPYTIDPNNNDKMYLAAGKFLWRNDSLGGIPLAGNYDSISTYWTRINDSVTQANTKISAVHVTTTPGNRAYFGTTLKKIYRIDNASVGQPLKTDITSNTVIPNGNVSCITSNPNNGDEMLLSMSNYGIRSVFYHPTGGLPTTGWTAVGGNLDPSSNAGPSVRWASIIPVSDGKIYLLATSTGLYATDTLMGMSTIWVQQATNTIGNAICDMIDFRVSDGLVVVATHSHGMYSTNLTSVGDIVTVKDLETQKFTLGLLCYPNPFSEAATISFMLDKAQIVRVELLDELGRTIREIRNEKLSPGNHEIRFSAGALAAGTYYVSVRAGEMRESRSVILVK